MGTLKQDTQGQLRGSMTALVTPFRSGEVDFDALDRLVDRQLAGGTDCLVACGTTAETPVLADSERGAIVDAVIKRAEGKCPVMVGTGSNSTAHTIEVSKAAASAGADSLLVVTPYYNRPPQEGLYRHYAAVADAVDIPIVVYNVPARTGVSISTDTLVRLRDEYPHIVAVKHATGSVDGITQLLGRCDLAVLSGDDTLIWPMMSVGAVGAVSVVSNLHPGLVRSLVAAALDGDAKLAMSLHGRVHRLADRIGRVGPNPIPVKTALALLGVIEEEFRLPLCPVDEAGREMISDTLRLHEVPRMVES